MYPKGSNHYPKAPEYLGYYGTVSISATEKNIFVKEYIVLHSNEYMVLIMKHLWKICKIFFFAAVSGHCYKKIL